MSASGFKDTPNVQFQHIMKSNNAWWILETSPLVLSNPDSGSVLWKYHFVFRRLSVRSFLNVIRAYITEHYNFLGIDSSILNVSSGAEMSSKARQIAEHFRTHGTPIMIGT